MRRSTLAGTLAAFALTLPALAQTTRDPASEAARGYAGVPSPAEPAVDAAQKPVTQALNNQGAAAGAAANATDAATRAQYDLDRAAYMDALVAHDRAVVRSDVRYVRQQNAYADAMAVWRAQADACKRGKRKACNAPTPNPADFY